MNCLFCNKELNFEFESQAGFSRYDCKQHISRIFYNIINNEIHSYVIGTYPYIFISLIDKQSTIVIIRNTPEIDTPTFHNISIPYILNCTPENYLQKIKTLLIFS